MMDDDDDGDDWGWGSNLEDWLVIGLTEDELEYVMDTVMRIKSK